MSAEKYFQMIQPTSQTGMLACTFGDCREGFDLKNPYMTAIYQNAASRTVPTVFQIYKGSGELLQKYSKSIVYIAENVRKYAPYRQ